MYFCRHRHLLSTNLTTCTHTCMRRMTFIFSLVRHYHMQRTLSFEKSHPGIRDTKITVTWEYEHQPLRHCAHANTFLRQYFLGRREGALTRVTMLSSSSLHLQRCHRGEVWTVVYRSSAHKTLFSSPGSKIALAQPTKTGPRRILCGHGPTGITCAPKNSMHGPFKKAPKQTPH